MLTQLQTELQAYNAQLIAVSKTHPADRIMTLYEQGQRHFGENKVQELVDKHAALPADIRWHFIGHLQTNKVKYIAPFVHLIHAVDSEKLLREINKRAAAHERTIDVLLQLKIAAEDSKFGLSASALKILLEEGNWRDLPNVRIVGLMGMATYTDDQSQVSREFGHLQTTFEWVKNTHFHDSDSFKERSMGMSGDYPLALKAGSTMVRVGSLLFGQRFY